jgi:hypothetical protein
MLLSIDHVFADGDFTQELELYSLPTDAGQDTAGKCFDETIFPPTKDPQVKNNATTVDGPLEGATIDQASQAKGGSGSNQ